MLHDPSLRDLGTVHVPLAVHGHTSGAAEAHDALVRAVPGLGNENEIQIPLHVGENRSRTWIITGTADGLRLKHDHRLEDGSDDPVTQYGGDTEHAGTPLNQSFPAHHLTRHGEPRATFEFDLTDDVEPPPAPWGYEGT